MHVLNALLKRRNITVFRFSFDKIIFYFGGSHWRELIDSHPWLHNYEYTQRAEATNTGKTVYFQDKAASE